MSGWPLEQKGHIRHQTQIPWDGIKGYRNSFFQGFDFFTQKETRKQIVLKASNHKNIKKLLHTQLNLRFKPLSLFLVLFNCIHGFPKHREGEKDPTSLSVAQDLNIFMGFDLVYTQAY